MNFRTMQQIKERGLEAAKSIKDLPRNELIVNFENKIKKRQIEWTAKGEPITEAELEYGLKEEWKLTGWIYQKAGISFDNLLEVGKRAIADTSGTFDTPADVQTLADSKIVKDLVYPIVAAKSVVQRFKDKIGRNKPCPCGSGLKYKKCCGR